MFFIYYIYTYIYIYIYMYVYIYIYKTIYILKGINLEVRIEPIQFEATGCLAAQARSLLLVAQQSFSCATVFQFRNTARGLWRLRWRFQTHVAESRIRDLHV